MKNKKQLNRKFNKDNADKYLEYGIDIDNRIVNLTHDISQDTISICMSGILLMLAKDKEKDIHIYINSFGGCPYTSMGFYNFLRSLKTITIKTYNVGCVMSGASIIFMAGDERYMYEDTVFMFHSVSSGAEGKVHLDLVDEAEECKRIHTQLCNIYAKHTNKTKKQWDALIKYKDRYYRADESLKIGIVHKVIVDNDDREV